MFRIILVSLTALCLFLVTPAFSAEVARVPKQEGYTNLILNIYGNPVGFSVGYWGGKCVFSSPVTDTNKKTNIEINKSLTIFVEGEKDITIKCLPDAIVLERN